MAAADGVASRGERGSARVPAFVRYAVRRLAVYVVSVLGAWTAAFFFFHLIPGNPIAGFVANMAQQNMSNAESSAALVAHYKQVFGLQGNLLQQYGRYMYQLLWHHDLGPSLVSFPTNSATLILHALPWTIGLLGVSTAIAWVLGLVFGALVGWSRAGWAATAVSNIALVVSSVPYYFLALALVFLLAYMLNLLPASNAYGASQTPALTLSFAWNVVRHALIPGVSIVVISSAGWLISTRMLLVSQLGEDYLRFARAKGLPPGQVLRGYALRNCYLPQITGLAISLGFIFNGNILIEELFVYPGVGHLFVTALLQLDYDTVQGIVFLVILAVLTASLVLDLVLPLVDPRITYS